MSSMFSSSSRKLSSQQNVKQSHEIAKRDMSQRKKVIRKVQQLAGDGKIKLTTVWTVELESGPHRVSFSRDNLHVWVDGKAVETTSYISDKGYDVDLFFEMEGMDGHIYSDVEGSQMMNYLLLDGDIKGRDLQMEDTQ